MVKKRALMTYAIAKKQAGTILLFLMLSMFLVGHSHIFRDLSVNTVIQNKIRRYVLQKYLKPNKVSNYFTF